jgi:hypothetical protein
VTNEPRREAPLADRITLLESRLETATRLISDTLSLQRSMQATLRDPHASRAAAGSASPTADRDDRETRGVFGEWVLWLVQTYDLLLEWPLCWYRHAGFVGELRSLHDFHRAVAVELAEDPRAGFAWHDCLWRFRARALTPIKCPVTGHTEPTEAMVASGKQKLERLRVAYAASTPRFAETATSDGPGARRADGPDRLSAANRPPGINTRTYRKWPPTPC